MVTKKDIEKLAKLSRLALTEEEKETFTKEIDSILSYIDEIKHISLQTEVTHEEVGLVYNVLREDEHPEESGVHVEALLAEAPESKNGYIKVKKIL